jgi:hypothetical protein
MTRRSKRDLGRTISARGDGETRPSVDWMVMHEDPGTGEWYADPEHTDGPLDKASTDPLMILQETVVKTGDDE